MERSWRGSSAKRMALRWCKGPTPTGTSPGKEVLCTLLSRLRAVRGSADGRANWSRGSASLPDGQRLAAGGTYDSNLVVRPGADGGMPNSSRTRWCWASLPGIEQPLRRSRWPTRCVAALRALGRSSAGCRRLWKTRWLPEGGLSRSSGGGCSKRIQRCRRRVTVCVRAFADAYVVGGSEVCRRKPKRVVTLTGLVQSYTRSTQRCSARLYEEWTMSAAFQHAHAACWKADGEGVSTGCGRTTTRT